MRAFSGTWRLFRLALRRDRVKLPIIILIVAGLMVSSVQATIDFYGKSQDDINNYVATTASSATSRLFSGPIGGPNIGAVVLNETYIMMLIAAAFVSSMAIVRHTRQNEEFGRSELIESGIVSRHASLVSALLLAFIINLVLAAITFVSLFGFGLAADGSFYSSAAVFLTGMGFAGIASIAVQLADSARGANAYGALMIGSAFILRAIGDVGGKLDLITGKVSSGFLSWLSPFGWAQQIFPFNEQKLWIYWLFVMLIILSIGIAVFLMTKRDVGMGMIPTKLGRATAKKSLLSVFGLTARLQRGILRGWSIAVIVFGAIFGLTVKEFESFLEDSEEVREAFAQYGSGDNYQEIFLAVIISMMAIMVAGYAVQALLRARSEESSGQLESVLAANVGRTKWLVIQVMYVLSGVMLLLILMGSSMGISYVLSTNGPAGEILTIIGSSVVQFSAILALAGIIIAIYGIVPKFIVPISWGLFAASLLLVQLGSILKLPQFVMNLSPFVHLPALPASEFKLAPVLALLLVGMVMSVLGIICFAKRDLSLE